MEELETENPEKYRIPINCHLDERVSCDKNMIVNMASQKKHYYSDPSLLQLRVLAFHDISPQAPVHFLVIPKKRIAMLEEIENVDQLLLGKLMLTAVKAVRNLRLKYGYRIVLNNGRDACRSVFHLHLHVLGGRQLAWPPGFEYMRRSRIPIDEYKS